MVDGNALFNAHFSKNRFAPLTLVAQLNPSWHTPSVRCFNDHCIVTARRDDALIVKHPLCPL